MSRVLFSMLVLVLMSGWISGITPVSQAKVIGAWLFNEGKGNVAKDSAGNGFDLEVVKGKWLEGGGSYDGALGFSMATYAWIEVKKKDAEFNLDKGEFTIITRGYLTGLSSCCAGIPRWEALSGDFDRAGWLIHPDTGAPDYVFSWWYNDGGWTKAGSSGALKFKAEWHQFAVTFDTKRILMYLDGEEIADFPANRGPTPFEDGGTLTYSRDRCCVPPRMFTGAIDESLIADEAFSAAVIAESAKKGLQNTAAFRQVFAVDARGKLATTWSRLKTLN
ncbi:MAG: hypothetical protein OXP71_12240 [Candidatus Poribacteria bacterium]|nr:hypothetical protein [Candidatus Poribacteria bacterium]